MQHRVNTFCDCLVHPDDDDDDDYACGNDNNQRHQDQQGLVWNSVGKQCDGMHNSLKLPDSSWNTDSLSNIKVKLWCVLERESLW